MDIVKPKNEEEKKDLEINKVIKPKLQKFVIDQQVNKAKETALQGIKDNKEMLSDDQIKIQCAKLSLKAFSELKLWKTRGFALDTPWIIKGLVTDDMVRHFMEDVSGFSSFLLREYYTNYLKLKDSADKGYRNPLNEDNLPFFWDKFNGDIKLLLIAEQRRKNLGNAGIILPD